MKRIISAILFLTFAVALVAQNSNDKYCNDNPAYVIFGKDGSYVTYKQMMTDIANADICLFGEQHNDPISHWLKLEIVKGLHAKKGSNLVVGAEMWERDNQLILDEMLVQDLVDGPTYMESSKLWPNVDTDYLPILQYVKSNGLRFIATNTPRRYARLIYKKGPEYLDSLSDLAKSYLPPLPIHYNLNESIYQFMARPFPSDEEWDQMKAEGKLGKGPMSGGRPSNLVKAQAVKDATMGYFIVNNMNKGDFFFHFHGELHSANFTAIYYYINYYAPGYNIKTVSVIKQSDALTLSQENINRADYIVVVPDNMAVTYK